MCIEDSLALNEDFLLERQQDRQNTVGSRSSNYTISNISVFFFFNLSALPSSGWPCSQASSLHNGAWAIPGPSSECLVQRTFPAVPSRVLDLNLIGPD